MFSEYIHAINKQTRNSPIFYVSPSIYRAAGLEELLENYHIITCGHTYCAEQMLEKGIHIGVFEKKENAGKLLQDNLVKEYILKNTGTHPNLMYFKPSSVIEKIPGAAALLVSQANIAGQIENKVTQYQLLLQGGFEEFLPKTCIYRIPDVTYEMLAQSIGNTFVAQLDMSHSGDGTFFIRTKDDFQTFYKKYAQTNIKIKFTAHAGSHYYTINAAATKYGTYCAGLCNQITGISSLGASEGETCGNNWYQTGMTNILRSKLQEITEQVGIYLFAYGFRGMFGIDFSVDDDSHIAIIEINARQTASVQYHTKLQIESGEIPLELIHILEFMDIAYSIDSRAYNRNNNYPLEASLLIMRNHHNGHIKIRKPYNGLYTVDTQIKKEDGYTFEDIYSNTRVLILEENEGSIIKKGEEYCRLLAKENVMETEHTLHPYIEKFASTIEGNNNKEIIQ